MEPTPNPAPVSRCPFKANAGDGVSYDFIRGHYAWMDAEARAGRLTEDDLDLAVRLEVYDPSDGPPESLGWNWIRNQPEAFARCIADPLTFYRRHLGHAQLFFRGLLMQTAHLLLIKDLEQRNQFFIDAFTKIGAWNNGWVKEALNAGLPRNVLAEAVRQRLRASAADKDLEYNFATYAQDFIRYGRGHDHPSVGTPTEWGLFSDDEFGELVALCAEKTPKTILRERGQIVCRLGKVETYDLCIDIARERKSIEGLSQDVFEALNINERKSLCLALETVGPIGITFIMNTLFRIKDEEQRLAFWHEVRPVLKKAGLETACKHVKYAHATDPEYVHIYLERWARDEGYVLGRLVYGEFTRRGETRSSRQLELRDGNTVYIQERSSHRFYPSEGDLVLVKKAHAHHLAQRGRTTIKTAYFLPAEGKHADVRLS